MKSTHPFHPTDPFILFFIISITIMTDNNDSGNLSTRNIQATIMVDSDESTTMVDSDDLRRNLRLSSVARSFTEVLRDDNTDVSIAKKQKITTEKKEELDSDISSKIVCLKAKLWNGNSPPAGSSVLECRACLSLYGYDSKLQNQKPQIVGFLSRLASKWHYHKQSVVVLQIALLVMGEMRR
jgi:hypothetical protein